MARGSRRIVLIALAILVALAAIYQFAFNEPPAGQRPLVSLQQSGVQEFKTAFNDAAGDTRVILLMSPT